MTEYTEEPRCFKRVWNGARGMTSNPCSRRGKVEIKGNWYCKQHDPEEIAKKDAIKWEEYEQEQEVRKKASERRKLETLACKSLSSAALEAGVIEKMVEYIKDMPFLCSGKGPYRDLDQLKSDILALLEAS